MYGQVGLLLVAVLRAGERPALHPAALGGISGLTFHLPLLIWVANPAGHVAWILLALIQAAFTATFAAVVWRWRGSAWLPVVAATTWTGLEAWRGVVPLSGFDWGALGYALVDSPFVGFARVTGVRGLSFVAVLAAAGVVVVLRRSDGTRVPRVALSALAVGAVLPLVQPSPPPATSETVDVLAVQGNDQLDPVLSGAALDESIAAELLRLTEQSVSADGQPDLTIWPESSIDRDPEGAGAALVPYLEAGAAVVGGNLLAGVNLDGPRPRTFLNAAVLYDAEGDEVDRYIKRHLVPFGEYVPFRSLIGELGPLRQVPRDGLPGPGPGAIVAGAARVAVAICFETLFPGEVRDNVRAGDANLLLASTNDASFGRSSEPAQHLAQSRLRAVETGRWLIHAGLSGTSAFVGPDGSVTSATDLYTATTIRAELPLVTDATAFLRLGDLVGTATRLAVLALLITAALTGAARRRQESTT